MKRVFEKLAFVYSVRFDKNPAKSMHSGTAEMNNSINIYDLHSLSVYYHTKPLRHSMVNQNIKFLQLKV